MTVNERIKEIRKSKKLTMESFGKKLGVGRSAISNMEYGQICAELGINDSRAKQIILNYGRFSSEDKKLFWEYIDRLISTTEQSNTT